MSAWTILDLVVKATFVLGLGLAATRALRARAAAVRHALLVATTAAAAALPALMLALPDWNVPLLAERDDPSAAAPAPAHVGSQAASGCPPEPRHDRTAQAPGPASDSSLS